MAETMDETDMKLRGKLKKIITQKPQAKQHQSTIPQRSKVKEWYLQNHEHQESFEYNMKHQKKGRALIINNKNFATLPTRDGTDVDQVSLTRTLSNLGFKEKDIVIKSDETSTGMQFLLNEMAGKDFKDYDCSFVAILSHGNRGEVYGTDDMPVPIIDLIEPFTTSASLAGKPKIFLLQCCQGEEGNEGMDYEYDGLSHSKPAGGTKIPIGSDILIANSTLPGNVSFRSETTGSWFIQSFCEVMDVTGRQLEFQQSLTRVCHIVSKFFLSNTPSKPETHDKKQSPIIASTLTKDIYF